MNREELNKRLKQMLLKQLTPEKEAWFVENYANMETTDMVSFMGYSRSTLYHYASAYQLHKSRDQRKKYCKAIAVRRSYKQKMEGRKYKRGRPFNKGFCIKDVLTDQEWEDLKKKQKEGRAKTIEEERRRINWGLPQKTNLKLFGKGKKRTNYEFRMRRKGYVLVSNYTFKRPAEFKIPMCHILRSEKHGETLGYKFV